MKKKKRKRRDKPLRIYDRADEIPRRTGPRKGGRYYVIADSLLIRRRCRKLPRRIVPCRTCDLHARGPWPGWHWIAARHFLGDMACCPQCRAEECLLYRVPEVGGLLWISGLFYRTPEHFLKECAEHQKRERRALCYRIMCVPRNWQAHRTPLLLLAHTHTWIEGFTRPHWAVFAACRPTAIEYIVRGDETRAALQKIVNRGARLVRLTHTGDNHHAEEYPT